MYHNKPVPVVLQSWVLKLCVKKISFFCRSSESCVSRRVVEFGSVISFGLGFRHPLLASWWLSSCLSLSSASLSSSRLVLLFPTSLLSLTRCHIEETEGVRSLNNISARCKSPNLSVTTVNSRHFPTLSSTSSHLWIVSNSVTDSQLKYVIATSHNVSILLSSAPETSSRTGSFSRNKILTKRSGE